MIHAALHSKAAKADLLSLAEVKIQVGILTAQTDAVNIATRGAEMNLKAGLNLLDGRYELLKVLGRGAQGEVWLAQQHGLGDFKSEVVLKFNVVSDVPKEQAPQLRKRFMREAHLVSQLHHANIIEIFNVGQEGEYDFIAMEYVQGKMLTEVISRHTEIHQRPLPWNSVLLLMVQICSGLEYAHTKKNRSQEPLGIIHRDLKPSNLMLGESGIAKIIDFGIAKAKHKTRTTAQNSLKGTPAYMAPEALQDPRSIDARADLFSLGVVFYELCTGHRPFLGETIYELMFSVLSKEPIPFSRWHVDIPTQLCELGMKLLEKEPEKRFQDAGAVKAALLELCEELEVELDLGPLEALYRELFAPQAPARQAPEAFADTASLRPPEHETEPSTSQESGISGAPEVVKELDFCLEAHIPFDATDSFDVSDGSEKALLQKSGAEASESQNSARVEDERDELKRELVELFNELRDLRAALKERAGETESLYQDILQLRAEKQAQAQANAALQEELGALHALLRDSSTQIITPSDSISHSGKRSFEELGVSPIQEEPRPKLVLQRWNPFRR